MSDIQTIELNDVQSTCVVDSYTVVDTPRTPVHNTPCPLHGCTTLPFFILAILLLQDRDALLFARARIGFFYNTSGSDSTICIEISLYIVPVTFQKGF